MTQAAPSSYILRNMSEVPNPDVISWFPQTLGWQVLALLIAAFIIYKFALAYCNKQMQRYRKEAKQVLEMHRNTDEMPLVCYDVLKSTFHYLYPNQPQQFNRAWLSTLSQTSDANLSSELDLDLGEKWLKTLVTRSVVLTDQEAEQVYDMVWLWVDTHTTPTWLKQHWSLSATILRALNKTKRAISGVVGETS